MAEPRKAEVQIAIGLKYQQLVKPLGLGPGEKLWEHIS